VNETLPNGNLHLGINASRLSSGAIPLCGVILVIDAFYLMGWHGVALTLAYVWIVAKRLTRKVIMRERKIVYCPDGRETWVEGPGGRVKIMLNGWPEGFDAWSE
jgi:hypothetical protein